ncbi:hypothetical protein IP88_09505 [alpha proteobacterium AAP81b]|nr:hypothetical protein IP88_09505 [alpha proteobacterium AAP81b]
MRFVGRTLWITALTLWYVPLHLIAVTLTGKSRWPKYYLRRVTRALGIKVATRGTPLRNDVFFVGNHLSWTDPLALGGVTGTAFIAQDRIRDWPIFGRLCALNHTIFVSRTDKMQVGTQVAEIRAAIADLHMLGLFPEGTTTDGRSLLPFKAPLFAVMVPPPHPTMIQCVLFDFDDAGRDLAWIGIETATQNAWRVLTRKGTYNLTIHFLEPFDPMAVAGGQGSGIAASGRKAVSAECRRRLAGALSESLGGVAIA